MMLGAFCAHRRTGGKNCIEEGIEFTDFKLKGLSL
jgi:hypothetical protein